MAFRLMLPGNSNYGGFDNLPHETCRVTRGANGIIKPNPKYALTIAASDVIVPRSPKFALSIPECKLAMEKEIKALHDDETWTLVPRQPGDNVISTKWVFKVKPKEDSSIERFKARLVANGMRQVHGLYYLDMFSPIVQPLSMCLVLALAVTNGWLIHQIDVSNAFLHGKLEERIVVSGPLGFRDASSPGHVCLLRKSLYGLKQSPRCWFQHLCDVLNKLGLEKSRVDPSVFLSKQGVVEVHVCIYIDEIIIISSDDDEITRLLGFMAKEFPIRDLGDLKFFLGIQVSRVNAGLHLSQTQYLVNLLHNCDMENLKPAVTPMVANLDLQSQEGLLPNAGEYRRIIGSLQYITLTRLDVQLVVNHLSQFMASLEQVRWTAMKRVLCFLSGTPNHGIILQHMLDRGITANYDAD